jgi:hypothetical protein
MLYDHFAECLCYIRPCKSTGFCLDEHCDLDYNVEDAMADIRSRLIVNVYFCFTPEIIFFSEDAEMEYLKIAQDLEMYGISYFSIKVHFCSLLVPSSSDS